MIWFFLYIFSFTSSMLILLLFMFFVNLLLLEFLANWWKHLFCRAIFIIYYKYLISLWFPKRFLWKIVSKIMFYPLFNIFLLTLLNIDWSLSGIKVLTSNIKHWLLIKIYDIISVWQFIVFHICHISVKINIFITSS